MSVAGRQLRYAALPPSHAPRFKPGNVTCSKESVTYVPRLYCYLSPRPVRSPFLRCLCKADRSRGYANQTTSAN